MNISGFSSNGLMEKHLKRSDRAKTFVLPNKCFEKHIACAWRRGNNFTIYPRSQTVSKNQGNTSDNKILKVRQEILLFIPILRKLINDSNGVFLSLQKVAENTNSDNQVEFWKLSRQYRSIVRSIIENLQEAAEEESDALAKNSLNSYATIFYSIECIWHLCEILFIKNIPGDVVLPFLLEWVCCHFPSHDQTAAQLLEARERGSEDHPEYWDTVVSLIIQGRIDDARDLLRLHSDSESAEFKLVANSLRTMPVYNIYGGISSGEFTIVWKHWQAECRAILNSQSLSSLPYLQLIMRLLIGDYTAFESICSKYPSWFYLLGGYVLFTRPWSRRRELADAAAACAGLGAAHAHSHLNTVIRALLEGDLHQMIYEIQQMSDNGWFATHLTDMLYHCGKLQVLDEHQTDMTKRLRDSLVLEYGSLVMEHGALWCTGLSYLVACAPEGPRRAELLLERLPLDSEEKAMRIIAEAKKYDLLGVVQTVCACMSARWRGAGRGAGRVGAALAWAGRARGAGLCAGAAHAALRGYCAGAPLPAADMLLSAGPTLLMDDTLLLLGKYSDFHRLYNNKEFKKAAKLLISLITSKIAPEYFWETLLLDTLPLLESEEPVFSSTETYEILLCLELRAKLLTGEKADLLRLACARNLARTVLLDGVEE
ncbi:nuclear pore complex protein Nup85 [Papilio machaon]|uniref:nuclear pore complex protein Nup85 n=1 Tax=Papilio machaon TaxID=76193 RepID=UPI001E6649E1|nr:nuclear pore complex protein Nup85 [Papilio machaon]